MPLTPPPVRPEPVAVVIPVSVPVPGNVCPVTNVIWPVLAMCSPVSAGFVVPEPNRRFKVAEAVVLSLFTASACSWKVWLTAAVLLYADATIVMGCEFLPAVAVATPVAGRLSVPRTVLPPLMSNVVAGVVVPMPTLAVAPVPD